jgi:hypothetical protein
MTEEFLSNRLQQFAPEYRDFVTSDFVEVVSQEVTIQYNLDERVTATIENMLFLYLLLVLNKYELIEALITEADLSIDIATAVAEDSLAKLPSEMVSAQESVFLELTPGESAVTEKDRLAVIKSLPARRRYAYLFAKTNQLLEGGSAKLSPEQVEQGRILLGDIALGFYRTEDTVPLLQQELGLDPKTAALLGAEVIEFMTLLADPNWQPPTGTNTIQSTATTIPVKSPILSMPAVAMPPAFENTPVNPLPTANNPLPTTYATPAPSVVTAPEPVYQSTQPTAAQPALSSIPSYTPAPAPTAPATPAPAPDRPRWSTDI